MLKAKQFLHIDFMAAVGAAGYAALVAGVEPLMYLADVFATPKAAVGFAAIAIGRWAMGLRKAEGGDA